MLGIADTETMRAKKPMRAPDALQIINNFGAFCRADQSAQAPPTATDLVGRVWRVRYHARRGWRSHMQYAGQV
jgi:hypothetical protein